MTSFRRAMAWFFLIIIMLSSTSGLYSEVLASASQDCNDANSEVCAIDVNSDSLFSNDLQPGSIIKSVDNSICAVYFSGINCPNCAKVDPYIFKQYLKDYNFTIIEYEVQEKKSNAPLFVNFNDAYGSGFGIPLMLFDANEVYIGYDEVISKTKSFLEVHQQNNCPLPESIYSGASRDFPDIDLNQLAGLPNIWRNNKVLYKVGQSNINSLELHYLLDSSENTAIDEKIRTHKFTILKNKAVGISGDKITFDNAVEMNGWRFYWNGNSDLSASDKNYVSTITEVDGLTASGKISLWKVISLAIVDAINPCAFAVLLMMLLAIMTYNPDNRKKVLLAGFAFSLAVFVMYFAYGLIIVHLFKLASGISLIKGTLYMVVAGLAVILGILEIKDFISYRPGGIGTEMPLGFKRKVKQTISKITSPSGALIIGAFVTLFLLPCTIGPYIILGGLLSFIDTVKTLPILLLYNIIFILPMLAITFIVYFGIKKVEDVAQWKDRNIRVLHLISGVIILLLGLSMLFGIKIF